MNKLFENFNEGTFETPEKKVDFKNIPWSKHPTFNGVELKHIVTSRETGGEFSYHLVRIAPNCIIKEHIHEQQLETHEVIFGSGECINNGTKIKYVSGTISIMPKGIKHEVKAGKDGLCLFAKFIPALC